ncbi:MAG: hypothetical protein MI919_08400 [Holophagales bacterium]|nr:hypothetical protein [Holophagales bacterium]
MDPGAVILLHLVEPAEKYWGQLQQLTPAGITIRAVNLESFEDWLRSLSYGEEAAGLGLATIFFPLRRVERMFLDEPVGQIESLSQMLERRVGKPVEEILGIRGADTELTH